MSPRATRRAALAVIVGGALAVAAPVAAAEATAQAAAAEAWEAFASQNALCFPDLPRACQSALEAGYSPDDVYCIGRSFEPDRLSHIVTTDGAWFWSDGRRQLPTA